MYSISNVIVGVPLTKELSDLVDEWENDDERWHEWNDLGFETFYHGDSSGHVGYCGVQLGRWDECGDWIRVNPDGTLFYHGHKSQQINLVPSKEQLAEAKRKVDALDPELRALCPEFGVYIVQSSS